MDWIDDETYGFWEFKPSLLQKIKLFFTPITVAVDCAEGVDVAVKIKRLRGKIIITEIVERKATK